MSLAVFLSLDNAFSFFKLQLLYHEMVVINVYVYIGRTYKLGETLYSVNRNLEEPGLYRPKAKLGLWEAAEAQRRRAPEKNQSGLGWKGP